VTNIGLAALLALPVLWAAEPATAAAQHAPAAVDTVHVAPPTGKAVDRASILAALEQVRPGGTVQFAAGTYLVGDGVRVTTPRVTLLGHHDGTTLRGCDPELITDLRFLAFNCNGLQLEAGQQAVRDITFEHAYAGVYLGPGMGDTRQDIRDGGDRVEGNTFRTGYGIIVEGDWADPSIIRGNRFINTFHGIGISGGTVHLLENHFAVPQPELAPIAGFPSDAVMISPRRRPPGDTLAATCGRNVVAGNHIEGSPYGIQIAVNQPGSSCRGTVIRDNTIEVRRVRSAAPDRLPAGFGWSDESDSTFVGVPIVLHNYTGTTDSAASAAESGVIEDNVIEGNRIIGAEGPGMHLHYASRNRIVNNEFSGIRLRDPFPGHTIDRPEPGRAGNGVAIWVSPGSDENEIIGNTFEGIASHAIVLEGDRNRVETRSGGGTVRDLGTDNWVELEVVQVAAPTGERDADRANIFAALAAVRPGGTIQFAPGTYLIGAMIRVAVPGVTLLGHSEGTTLRGCDPEGVDGRQTWMEVCNGLELAGARQTVRGFAFEHAFWALHLGCCFDERTSYDFPDGSTHELPVIRRGEGGHRVEGNTFRGASSGIRVNGGWTDPSIVRGNRFIDNWHAVSINGHTVHVLDNHFSVPQPERVPDFGYAWDAIKIAPPPISIQGDTAPPACVGNVIASNTIEGYLDGIRVEVYLPGSICRENVIRDNTITVRRAHNPSGVHFSDGGDPSDSSVVGVPIALLNDPIFSEYAGSDAPTFVEENIVEGNRILGAEGIGIEVLRASRNRIANNIIERVVAREPFPGNTMAGAPDAWRHANGSGIWISPGSEGNLVEGNVFDGIAHAAVVREGEVETDDGVRLYYRVEGEGPDTVVVLHGGPSLGHAYLAPDLVPLARGRVVVHYDQRGIGRSSPLTDPERLTIDRHVEDLDALRAHFGLERLTLLGHSWGAMLAARYGAAHPHRVERILLLDPMAPARDPFMAMGNARAQAMVRVRLNEPARARLDSLAATAEVADPGELCRERYSLLTPIFFEDPGRRARSRADFCAGTPVTMRNRPEVDAAIFGSLGEWDVRPALGHVRSPVLVVRGAEGAIPREAMDAWVQAFPNARLLTIEGAGHYPHVDRPEVFFPAAEVFFGGGWPETEAKAYQLEEVVP
jgi:proline-specific peptidase